MYKERHERANVNRTTSDLLDFYKQYMLGEAKKERSGIILPNIINNVPSSGEPILFSRQRAVFIPPTVTDINARDHK